MREALQRPGDAIAAPLSSRPARRTTRSGSIGKPFHAALAFLLCASAGSAFAAGAAEPVAPSSQPETVMRGVSAACLSIGDIVEKIARWRDAGGAPQRAQAEIARRVVDPDARAVAVSLVAQLYTGFARQMTPAQARQAYAASCALAQENRARATGNAAQPAEPASVPNAASASAAGTL